MAKDRFLFLISFIFLGVMGALLFRAPDSESAEVVSQDGARIIDQPKHVLVAAQDLNPGDRLDSSNFTWQVIDEEDVKPTMILKGEQSDQWLTQAIVTKEITAGKVIHRLEIMWPEEITSTGMIPIEKGKVAIPYTLDGDLALMTEFIEPGSYVDVIFTTKPELGFGSRSVSLVKNVKILAKAVPDQAKHGTRLAAQILLEMNPRQAEIFSYAQQTGFISLGITEEGRRYDFGERDLADLLLECQSVGNFNSTIVTYLMHTFFPQVDVRVDATTEGFIVSGKVNDPQVADKIMEILEKVAVGREKAVINLMEIIPQQVLICVKVFEVSRDAKYEMGVNWKALFDDGDTRFAVGATFPRPRPSDPNYFLDFLGSPGNWTLSAMIDILEERGLGRVIAEPNLTTISGQPAEFFAGGEFPILVPQGGTLAGTVTIEYKRFGVILNFTPFIDLNGLITLHIVPEVSRLDRQNSVVIEGFVIPSLITRRADTTVKLWSGQSYGIAGLIQAETLSNMYGICGLDRLPVIGPLFRSKEFINERTEIMIMITPYIVSSEPVPDCGPPDTLPGRVPFIPPAVFNKEPEVKCKKNHGRGRRKCNGSCS